MDSVTHIVGPFVEVQGRVIQRCLVCGEKLLDSGGTPMPIGKAFFVWESGRLLRVDRGIATLLDDQPLPADNCLSMVEA